MICKTLKTYFIAFIFLLQLTQILSPEENLYTIDDGFIVGMGMTNDREFVVLNVYFSLECAFECGVETVLQKNIAEKGRLFLEKIIRNYISKSFISKYSLGDIEKFISCKNEEVFDEFIEYYLTETEKREDLRVTGLKIEIRELQ
jgi:hypothetical protein